ncbi:MAG: hypothetical protein ACYC8T_18590 [Myxococcaceae bacterium]
MGPANAKPRNVVIPPRGRDAWCRGFDVIDVIAPEARLADCVVGFGLQRLQLSSCLLFAGALAEAVHPDPLPFGDMSHHGIVTRQHVGLASLFNVVKMAPFVAACD